MKTFKAKFNGREVEFQASLVGDRVSIQRDGRLVEFQVRPADDFKFTVFDQSHHSFDVAVCDSKSHYQSYVNGSQIHFEFLDERELRRQSTGGAQKSGSGRIVAPMPGKVVDVKVKAGDTVTAGQGVVIVEAMKMQNEFKADIDGVVRDVKVKTGDSVEGGAVLISIEAA